jgi:hypothetical protein
LGSLKRKPLGCLGHRCEDSIEMILKIYGVDWFHLAQDMNPVLGSIMGGEFPE